MVGNGQLPVVRVVESEHCDTDARADASSPAFDLESIAVFFDLLNLHCDVAGDRWR